jgi:tetratricopeptide (TPR) repeat protein
VDVGQDEEGVEIYLQINADSIYYPRARAEVHRLADLLKRRYDEQCHQAQRDSDNQGILASCTRYLNLVCNSVLDQTRLKLVRAAEQKLGAKNRSPPWSCPATYARWFSEDAIASTSSLSQRIGQKYKNPGLAEAVRLYANGQSRQAMNRLSALKVTPAEAHNAELDQVLRQIELADGAYHEGVSALGTGDWRTAQRQWSSLFDIDKQILPEGDASALADDARTQLAKQFYKMGQQQFQQGRLEDAYATWDQGFQINQGNADLMTGFIALEQEATKRVSDDASCDDLGLVLKITRPTSLSHKKAMRLAKERQCQP